MVYLLIGLCYATGTRGTHVLLLVVAAIATFACTLGPVTWVVLSEIFPNRARGRAMSLAVFALWAGCFTLTYTFPLLNRAFGPAGTFWIYAAICAAGVRLHPAPPPRDQGEDAWRRSRPGSSCAHRGYLMDHDHESGDDQELDHRRGPARGGLARPIIRWQVPSSRDGPWPVEWS